MFQSTRRWWRKRVRSVGWPLRVVFLIAVGASILHDFVFWDPPELFPSASRLWELAYLLSLAWVASIVVFYIDVHQMAVREKERLRSRAKVGGQLFAHGNAQRDCTAF